MKQVSWICALLLFFLSPPATKSQEPPPAFWEQKIQAFAAQKQWDSLDHAYAQYLAFLRKNDDLAAWLFACWDWQSWHFDDNEHALAILNDAVNKAWRQPRSASEIEAMLWVHTNRGYHFFQLGNVVASIQAYEQALKWYRLHPPPDFEALDYLFLPLGAHYTRLGDNEKARTLYELAISSHPAGPRDASLAGVYNNLSLTWWNEGNYRRALEVCRRGLECKLLPPEKTGLLHLSMAQSFFDLEQMDSAAHHLNQAFKWLNAAHHSEEVLDYRAGAWLLKGKLLAQNRRFSEGEKAMIQALSLESRALGTTRHRAIGKIYVALGQLYLAASNPAEALKAFNNALASVLPTFDPQQAEALPAQTALYEENTLLEALEGKADAALLQFNHGANADRLQLALRCHQLATAVDLRLRMVFQYESSKLSLQQKSRQRLQKALNVAYRLWQLTGKDDYVWEGWHFAEQAKAMVLLEGLLQQRHRTNTPQAKILALRQQLAYYEKQLLLFPNASQRNTWLAERQNLMDTLLALQKKQPEWQNMLRQLELLSTAQVKNIVMARPQQQVVEFFTGPGSISVFSYGGSVTWLKLSDVSWVDEKVARLLQWLPSRAALDEYRSQFCQDGHALYQYLLATVIDSLPTQKPLLIVPDGPLSFLPFETLPTAPVDATWQEVPFLIRRHPVSYAYSLFVLDSQQKLPSNAPRNLLHVAPLFSQAERNLTPLLNSKDEAPGSWLCKSKHLIGPQATFGGFAEAATAYKILHLSTHAGVDSTGTLPRIEFYDRSAWLPDVYTLPLQADLVVLSACQTGLGKFVEGEGVMSLSRAFTAAGAKGLVASQWTINEAATATLLKSMYGYLRKGLPKYLALHHAKLDWLNNPEVPPVQKSPYYWAALVYVGDTYSVQLPPCPTRRWWVATTLLVFMGAWWWNRKRNRRHHRSA